MGRKWGVFWHPPLQLSRWLLTALIITAVIRPYRWHMPRLALWTVYLVVWFLQSVGLALFWGMPGPALFGCISMGIFFNPQLQRIDPMSIEQALFIVGAFWLGAIPFSYLIGKLGLKKDIRTVGDGNPGGFNVLKSGGIAWGGFAIFLDAGKAALPVGLATHIFLWNGLPLVLIAIAPVFGHAFTPFLRFKGGKAIASTGGVSIGFSILLMPIVLMIVLIGLYLILISSGWATMLTWCAGLIFLLVTSSPLEWLMAWLIIGGLVAYKHRAELRYPPQLKQRTGTK